MTTRQIETLRDCSERVRYRVVYEMYKKTKPSKYSCFWFFDFSPERELLECKQTVVNLEKELEFCKEMLVSYEQMIEDYNVLLKTHGITYDMQDCKAI